MLIHPRELAEQACDIEIDRLHEPIGKQDQYIAAFGGLTCFRFNQDDSVEAWPLKIDTETLYNLEDNLLLFFTGYSRSASSILKEQDDKTKQQDTDMIENLNYVKDLGLRSLEALESGQPGRVRPADARALGAQEASAPAACPIPRSTNGTISRCKNGAAGGKLIGAGGGGFLMFYAEDKTQLRHAMSGAGHDGSALPLRLRGHEDDRPIAKSMTDMPPSHCSPAGLATRLRPLTETGAQGDAGGRRRAVHRAPASAAAPRRHRRGWCSASGYLAR